MAASTIRTVPSFERNERTSDSSSDRPSTTATRTSTFSSASLANAHPSALANTSSSNHINNNNNMSDGGRPMKPLPSSDELSGPNNNYYTSSPTTTTTATTTASHTSPDLRADDDDDDDATTTTAATTTTTTSDAGGVDANGQQAWDSTVGKAGLGKTGRVINKLVGENETLKREIKLERLRAEEAKQAAKLLEDRMDRTVADYESRLLEASVTKTLLARKERQVESLHAAVDQQRQRAQVAQDSERSWRNEVEKLRSSTTAQVDAANTHAALMEGRYNTLAGSWSTHETMTRKLRDDVRAVAADRARDDQRIATLHDLCDQQDSNIRALQADKERMADLFERYKRTQEDSLRHIKDQARLRESEQERLLEETREALHKLKWALQVKQNVKQAQ